MGQGDGLTHRGGAVLGLALAALMAPGSSSPASTQSRCGPWSDWSWPPVLGLSFSFRRCEQASRRIVIEWRWSNHEEQDVGFSYGLYTRHPGNCDQQKLRAWARGEHRLGARQEENFPSGRRALGQVDDEFWLYFCVVKGPQP